MDVLHFCCLFTKSRPTLLQPHVLQPTRLLCPRDFPGNDPGAHCNFLIQELNLKSPALAHGFFTTELLVRYISSNNFIRMQDPTSVSTQIQMLMDVCLQAGPLGAVAPGTQKTNTLWTSLKCFYGISTQCASNTTTYIDPSIQTLTRMFVSVNRP